jgi:hypothetical protein
LLTLTQEDISRLKRLMLYSYISHQLLIVINTHNHSS